MSLTSDDFDASMSIPFRTTDLPKVMYFESKEYFLKNSTDQIDYPWYNASVVLIKHDKPLLPSTMLPRIASEKIILLVSKEDFIKLPTSNTIIHFQTCQTKKKPLYVCKMDDGKVFVKYFFLFFQIFIEHNIL